MPLVDLDHHSLREAFPATRLHMARVPAEGDSLTFAGQPFVVHHVRWRADASGGDPAARVVLRTPDEARRAAMLRE